MPISRTPICLLAALLLGACSTADTSTGPGTYPPGTTPGPGGSYGYDAYVPGQPGQAGYPVADGGAVTPQPAGDAAVGGGGCDDGRLECDDRCVNVQTDPKNCGFCGNSCPSGLCSGGVCQASTKECEYYQENVCGGDQAMWCGSGSCVPCANGRFNCDRTGGCECETGCDNDRCTDPVCDREVAFDCGSDVTQWCYHKDGPTLPGQCKTCSSTSHTRNLNCDGIGKTGCECTSKEQYVSGTGYTGVWSHECQNGQCVQIN